MVSRLGWMMAGLLVVGVVFLTGCGGSKAPSQTNASSNSLASYDKPSGFGTVVLTVHWPERSSRVIPYATEEIVARLKRNGITLFEQVIDRSQSQVRFEKVPAGNWVLEAEARGWPKETGIRARGVVKAGNQPVSNAKVILTLHYPSHETYTATTDANGKFAFDVFPRWFADWFEGVLQVVAGGYPEREEYVCSRDFAESEDGLVIDLLASKQGKSRKRYIPYLILASGAVSFTLGANEDKQVVVELASKLTDLRITPLEIKIAIGESMEVAVQGLIEQADERNPNQVWLYLVPLNPEKVKWQVADSSVASLSATTGVSVTVTGLREGQTVLTVTDEESGKSKQVSIQVLGLRIVTIRFQSVDGQPVNAKWAAFQDGQRNWQVVDPVSAGTYRLPVTDPEGRYGFAYAATNSWGYTEFNIIQATVDEMPEVVVPIESVPWFTVNGNLTGHTRDVVILIGDDLTRVAAGENTYSLSVPRGLWDIVAVELSETDGNGIAQRIYIHRDIQVLGNIVHNIDFGDTSKVRTLTPTHTINYTGGADYIYVGLITRNNWEYVNLASTFGNTLNYPSVPSDLLVPGDLYVAESEGVVRWFSTPQNLTLQTLSEELSGVNGSVVDGRLVISGLRYNGVNWWRIRSGNRSITLTPQWLGNSDTYAVPDLSVLPGWSPQWKIEGNFFVEAIVSNKLLQDIAKLGLLLSYSYRGIDGLELKYTYQWVNMSSTLPTPPPPPDFGRKRGVKGLKQPFFYLLR